MLITSPPAPTPARPLLRAALLLGGLALLSAGAIRWTERSDARRAVRTALASGAQFAQAVERDARRPAPRAEMAVAWSYFARLERGLGSPFRLVDLARSDPRMSPAVRTGTALGLLARLRAGSRALQPGRAALDMVVTDSGANGAALLAVIDSAVARAPDPAVALAAARIAVTQLAAAGDVRSAGVPVLGAAALLAHDRARAATDVEHLVEAAARRDGVLLPLVSQWRAERRFAVERPLLATAPPEPRAVAARVPALLAAAQGALRTRRAAPPPERPVPAARVFLARPDVQRRPPQPQVAVTALDVRPLVWLAHLSPAQPSVRRLLRVTHEEMLAAEVAAEAPMPAWRAVADAATLLVAQGLRTVAQEAPYHPGATVVDTAQVKAFLGLASLRFADDVPVEWRGFYAREFASAIEAMRLVFPAVNVTGLNVRIGGEGRDGTLALHEPRSRTLTLPVRTGFGAIAHEVMHDLDWQEAILLFGRRGTYATDASTRTRRPAALAAPLARLAAMLPPGQPRDTAWLREARRPAELLARGGDWYVAARLAAMGRMHGALSSVQDGWLPGYASAIGPDPTGERVAAVGALLRELTPLRAHVASSARVGVADPMDVTVLARLAWLTPLRVELLLPGALPVGTASSRCSPFDAIRVLPVREAARGIADSILVARIDRSLRRWAAGEAPADEPPVRAELRMALRGAPMDPVGVERARADALQRARAALPCLAE